MPNAQNQVAPAFGRELDRWWRGDPRAHALRPGILANANIQQPAAKLERRVTAEIPEAKGFG